jgi:hypothetical protein
MSRNLKLFNKIWKTGGGSQEMMINSLNPSSLNTKLFKCVVDNRHNWILISESDIIPLITNYNGFICEILHSYPKKVYFDVDCGDVDKIKLEDVKTIINKYFKDAKLSISGSETPTKKSYHIVVNNYILKDINDLQTMKNLVKYINENENKYFDWLVYTKNRAMKCVFQSKPDREKQLIIEDQKIENHLIGSFFNGNEKEIKLIIPDIQHKTEVLTIKDIIPNGESLKLPENFKQEDLINSKYLLSLMPCNPTTTYQLTYKMMIFSISNGLSFDDWWNWKLQKSDKSKEKYLFEWNNTIKYHPDYKFTIHTMKKTLSLIYPDLIEENETEIITKKFNKSLDIEQKLIDRIEKEHFLVKEKAILFNIGMGGGKTTMTVDYLKNSKKSFIWLAPRQALVMNTHQRYTQNNMNVVNYLNCGTSREIKMKKINDATNLILECESLNYLKDTNKYDVVVIDEIETVLNTWDSETHTNHIELNFTNFCNLLKNCKKIIFLDAFTTTKTTQFLQLLGINDYIIYGSLYKPKQKTLMNNTSYEETINKIADELDNNKKLYVFHAYKSSNKKHYSIEELKSKLLEICKTKPRILVYHGDMDDKKKKTLYNVNIEWDKYDCILTTSSITVGVNYEGVRFDKVYLMVAGCVNNVRDIIQTSMRIRKTKEDIIEMYFFNRMTKMTLKRPEYYNRFYTKEETMLKNYESEIKPIHKIFKKLIDDIFIEKQSDFMEVFFRFCSLTNYDTKNINKLEKFKVEKFQNDLFESKILIPYEEIRQLKDDEIKDYEIKVWNYDASMIEKFMIKKYYFDCKFWQMSEDDKIFIWNNRVDTFFDNYHNDLLKKIKIDNNINVLSALNVEEIKTSPETDEFIIKNYSNINIKIKNQKLVKCINYELGGEMIEVLQKKKNCKYQFSDLFNELDEIYKKNWNNDLADNNYFISTTEAE